MRDLIMKLLNDEHGDIKIVLAGAGFYALLPLLITIIETVASLFI